MCLCQFCQIPAIGSEDRVQTRSYADADRIRTKSTMPQLPPPLFFFVCVCEGVVGHNWALIDPVVSEKMFEECGRRHRRACLYDKLTNQYIKCSARIIRSKICRIKMTYTFEDAAKKTVRSNATSQAYFFLQYQSNKNDFEMRFCSETVSEKTYRTNLHIYRFNFSDAIFHRSMLCRGPNSEKVKLALSLEPYGIIWWNFPCPLILTRSRPKGCKISLSIHWSRLCRCPNCKNLNIAHK